MIAQENDFFCQVGLSVICVLIVRVKLEQIQLSRDQNTAVRHEQFRVLFLTWLLFIYEVVKCMCRQGYQMDCGWVFL